jgi:hypothetical protein
MKNLLQSEKLFYTGFLLLLLPAVILLLCSITFFIGGNVMAWQFPAAVILTGVITYFIMYNQQLENPREILVFSAFSALVVIGISVLVAGFFYDVTYDGQAYHQETLIQLKNGWNPYYQTLPESVNQALYINHYAKGAEITQSTIYVFSNRIETGKATNLILLAGSFLITLSLILQLGITNLKKSVVLSLLLAFNPITFNQLLTYYVDGQLATLLLCFFVAGILVIRQPKTAHLTLLAAVIIIGVNIKFTAVVYVALFTLALLGWLLLDKQIAKFKRIFFTSLAAGLFGLLIGFNPYVTNTVQYQHPFYPLMGKNKIDIISYNLPSGLEGKSMLNKFLLSNFSHTDNIPPYQDKKPELKLPFTFNKTDIGNAWQVDTRIGGFGPMFSGILLLSGLILILFLFCGAKRSIQKLLYFLLVIAVSVIIIPESWWARYIPQLWFFPLILLLVSESSRQKSLVVLRTALYLTIILNIGFMFKGIVWNLMRTIEINNQMHTLKSAKQVIKVDWGSASSNRIRFDENQIKYREQNLKGIKAEEIIHSDAKFILLKTASTK